MITTPIMISDRLLGLYNDAYHRVFFAAAAEPPEECRQSNVHQCTCFEVLGTNGSYLPSTKDLQKGFRTASKMYHPDKGGKAEDFVFLNSCYSHPMEPDIWRRYWRQLERIDYQRNMERWWESQFRSQIQQLNEEWIVNALAPRDEKTLYNDKDRKTYASKRKKQRSLLFCAGPLMRGVVASFVQGVPCSIFCDSRRVVCGE